jgi:glycosyltransferase involved in cell wall biosynthesis
MVDTDQMSKVKIFISMPVYNEANRIEKWLLSLNQAAGNIQPRIIIVNDNSLDHTVNIIQSISKPLTILLNNEENLGHGPSTLKGMRFAHSLMDQDSVLITVDGDGHYEASTVLEMSKVLLNSDVMVVEGLRINRNEPFYRKLTSLITRLIVLILTGKFSYDANTPFHAYRKDILGDILLAEFQKDSLVPNLHISKYLRKRNIPTATSKVLEQSLEFGLQEGTTWKTKHRNLPSKKFIKFCFNAMREILIR